MRSLLLLPAAVLCFVGSSGAADETHFATKADARAGRRTPGPAVRTPPPLDPDAGGENCGTATVIAAPLPFTDSDDTTGNASDVGLLPEGCSNYQIVDGPDLVYSFTVGAGNSVAFTVTPTSATYDPAIYVLGTCSDAATCVVGADACLRSGAASQPASCLDGTADEDLPAQAYAVGTHAVFVDSFYAAGASCSAQGGVQCGAGPYTLTVTGSLPVHLQRFEVE
jgi:hypothetical protein